MKGMRIRTVALLAVASAIAPAQVEVIDGITFADEPGITFVPIKEIGFRVGWEMTSDEDGFYVNGTPVQTPRQLFDGTRLARLRELTSLGVGIGSLESNEVPIWFEGRDFIVRLGTKRVVINKTEQKLRAFQGDRLIIETRVSTGRRGYTTPNGTWSAGPEKSRMRYSRKYDNSPMPWAVQIWNGYFMHGYPSVPKRPASHGCVRLLVREGNPAKWIWHWIDLGTPITVANDWADTDTLVAKQKPTERDTTSVGN